MYSLIILKPDAVKARLHGLLIAEINAKWNIAAMELKHLTEHQVAGLYGHLEGKPFWPRILSVMTMWMSVPIIVQSDEATVNEVRMYALEVRDRMHLVVRESNPSLNVIHATGRPEQAIFECSLVFPGFSFS